MNIFNRFHVYCNFTELITEGTAPSFLDCLELLGRRLMMCFYQRPHAVIVNSLQSILLPPNPTRRLSSSFYPSSSLCRSAFLPSLALIVSNNIDQTSQRRATASPQRSRLIG